MRKFKMVYKDRLTHFETLSLVLGHVLLTVKSRLSRSFLLIANYTSEPVCGPLVHSNFWKLPHLVYHVSKRFSEDGLASEKPPPSIV